MRFASGPAAGDRRSTLDFTRRAERSPGRVRTLSDWRDVAVRMMTAHTIMMTVQIELTYPWTCSAGSADRPSARSCRGRSG